MLIIPRHDSDVTKIHATIIMYGCRATNFPHLNKKHLLTIYCCSNCISLFVMIILMLILIDVLHTCKITFQGNQQHSYWYFLEPPSWPLIFRATQLKILLKVNYPRFLLAMYVCPRYCDKRNFLKSEGFSININVYSFHAVHFIIIL